MGYSTTSFDDLSARQAYRETSGSTFAHTAAMRYTPPAERRAHESVDPLRLNSVGQKIRECLDSPQHPITRGVVVGFDQTGSMGDGPRILQKKLASLKGSLLRAGLDQIQLLFGCYGDAQCNEAAPLQAGQFEAGIEMEDWLNNLYLEGNGGGNGGETSGLFLYFMGEHSKLDSLEKRGQKGLLFLIGDECPLPLVTKTEIHRYAGDSVEYNLGIAQVVAQARKSYDIYFLLVDNATAKQQGSRKVWERLLGEDFVIPVESLDTISELITMIVTRLEGAADSVDEVARILLAEGATKKDVASASTALARFDRTVGSTIVAATSGMLPQATTPRTSRRL